MGNSPSSHAHYHVAVVGAGIAGLATALSWLKRGKRVAVFEREDRTLGATIRNFGSVWPIGQRLGDEYHRAVKSRDIWSAMAKEADFEARETGSMQIARGELEHRVLGEYARRAVASGVDGRMISPEEARKLCPAVRMDDLAGVFFSPVEITVNPREVPGKLIAWLKAQGVVFHFNTAITAIGGGSLRAGKSAWSADRIFVCSGADLRTLYPDELAKLPIIPCKLQMMRTAVQPAGWKLGPMICAGLTYLHYQSFQDCPSLPEFRAEMEARYPKHLANGIHVLVSQNGDDGVTLGDTHEYAASLDPFLEEDLDGMVLGYLNEFTEIPNLEIIRRWHGVYAKSTDGATALVFDPEPGVTVFNGLGGAGMTLSFAYAEEIANRGR